MEHGEKCHSGPYHSMSCSISHILPLLSPPASCSFTCSVQAMGLPRWQWLTREGSQIWESLVSCNPLQAVKSGRTCRTVFGLKDLRAYLSLQHSPAHPDIHFHYDQCTWLGISPNLLKTSIKFDRQVRKRPKKSI